MKISRKFCWGLVALLIFVGLILLAGGGLFGGSEEKGQGVAYFCLGVGPLIGILLAIEWIIEVQKSSSLLETKEEKAEKRKDLCPEGRQLLKSKDATKTKEAKKYWNASWDKHKKKCPPCGRAKLN